ncbi:MAG: histidinol-phosphatase [Mycobacteriales bacterium]|nr:MAG: histidinol-phosphatase [Pseudonocardiales bacterium]
MSGASEYADDLALAHVLADDADATSMSRFRALDLRVETKPDMTPVTDADTAVEDAMRSTLQRVRRRDAILGEEMGRSGAGSRCWVIDPVDGTKNFVRGVPVWATLVALMDGNDVVAGVVSAPALGRRWWAARGTGAFTGRSLSAATPCHVSTVTKLDDASLSYSNISGWGKRRARFLKLTDAVWRCRAYGDFWSYTLLAEGAVDIACEPEVSVWDLAPLAIVVEEAGGRFTDLDGGAGPTGGSAVATNGALHAEVLDALRPQG